MALLSDQARVHAWVPFAARRTRETRRGPLRCPQPQRRCHRPPRHFPGPAYSGGARRARRGRRLRLRARRLGPSLAEAHRGAAAAGAARAGAAAAAWGPAAWGGGGRAGRRRGGGDPRRVELLDETGAGGAAEEATRLGLLELRTHLGVDTRTRTGVEGCPLRHAGLQPLVRRAAASGA